jgi:L-glutamine:2-deoxy-scyllo-inosose/3-amino-2,3-dideoxy-scyllo-inosose aminotransferase
MTSLHDRPAVLGGTPVVSHPMFHWPQAGYEEYHAVHSVISDGLFASGTEASRLPTTEFERRFADMQGARFAVTVTNGTHAPQLMLEAEGIGLGDVVFAPGLTWAATVSAVADVNALPWLVDIDPRTLAIDPDALEAAIDEAVGDGWRPRAVIAVHLYNRMADLDRLLEICRRRGLILLEDAAHAHGARSHGRGAGAVGLAGSFSLQRRKPITTGEGGVIITNDAGFAASVRSLRNCGRTDADVSPKQSGNFRLTEVQAALGNAQLDRFLRLHQPVRAAVLPALDAVAEGTAGISPLPSQPGIDPSPQYKWVCRYDVDAFAGLPASAVRAILAAELACGVEGVYDPLNRSPFWQPHTKPERHRLNDRYWSALDPARYALPACEQAWREAIAVEHTFALDPDAPAHLAAAFARIRGHLPQLIRWWRDRGAES